MPRLETVVMSNHFRACNQKDQRDITKTMVLSTVPSSARNVGARCVSYLRDSPGERSLRNEWLAGAFGPMGLTCRQD